MSLRPCGECGGVEGTVRNHNGKGEWLCYACLVNRRKVPTTELDISYFVKFSCDECGNTWPEYLSGGNPKSLSSHVTISEGTVGGEKGKYFIAEPNKRRINCPECNSSRITDHQDEQVGDTDMRRFV